ncbi:MAG: MBL fold metallo-hydrolase [Elusimicrobia bacterium]|nr:MBL fold metallo-hydrolase [Elusimicrobiota bacterium]
MKNLLLPALVLVGLGGCVPSEKVPGSGGELIQVQQGNVGAFRELRLGVANIVETADVDKAGAKKKGLMAALTLFLDGTPPLEKDFKVRAGQTVTMGKYSVYVEEIRGTTKGLVTFRIEDISGPAAR